MPERTLVPCRWFRCHRLIEPGNRYCDEHKSLRYKSYNKKRREDPFEAELQRFYSSKVWQDARNMHIRNNPQCVRCGGAAQMVDHITPMRLGGQALAESNLQSMCHRCHAKKTADDYALKSGPDAKASDIKAPDDNKE